MSEVDDAVQYIDNTAPPSLSELEALAVALGRTWKPEAADLVHEAADWIGAASIYLAKLLGERCLASPETPMARDGRRAIGCDVNAGSIRTSR
jgi:hypothetical protein